MNDVLTLERENNIFENEDINEDTEEEEQSTMSED